MILTTPDKRDLKQMLGAVHSFRRAWGSIGEDGSFRPLAADPRVAWVMIASDATQHSTMWRAAGLSTSLESSFAAMQGAKEHIVNLHLMKFRHGWFRSVWAANVILLFDSGQVVIGAIAGETQPALWDRFRALQEGRCSTEDTAEVAASNLLGSHR